MAVGGCVDNRAEMEKKILAADPSFQQKLEERNLLRKELDTSRAIFMKSCAEVDAKITALRENKSQTRQEYSMVVDKIKRQVQPEKRRLEEELVDVKHQCEIRKIAIKSVEKDIEEITALINRRDTLAMSQEEIRTWNERLATLVNKKEKLLAEVTEIQNKTDVTKLKIRVLEP